MKIDLHKFFQYIFTDRANVAKSLPSTLSEEARIRALKKSEEPIQDFFINLIPERLHGEFRHALRAMKSEHLERVLYDPKSQFEGNYTLPEDKEIDAYFKKLNDQYHYFSGAQLAIAKTQFRDFFKVRKIINDFIETPMQPQDEEVALQAFKMLVLFGNEAKIDFQPFSRYIEQHIAPDIAQPLHAALAWPIPVNEEKEKFDLKGWSKFIQREGPQAMQFFEMAPLIERELKKVPDNLDEALSVFKKMKYKKAEQNPQLADLSVEHLKDEATYDFCLDIYAQRKKKDNLPDIMIDGAAVGKPGYFLVKLPPDDPMAFFLGDKTKCCQTIGDTGQQVVIDGITRENNGFYVLLKEKSSPGKSKAERQELKRDKKEDPAQAKKPLKAGKINYQDFEIVGQANAWLTEQGNLTIDSWENANPGKDDRVAVLMLEKFAKEVAHDKESGIVRVLIGTGGKTPQKWAEHDGEEKGLPFFREFMREGTQYDDSETQVMIYCDQEKRRQIVEQLEIKMDEIFNSLLPAFDEEYHAEVWQTIAEIKKWMIRDCYSIQDAERTLALMQEPVMQPYIETLMSYKDFKNVKLPPWNIIATLYQHNIELPADRMSDLTQKQWVDQNRIVYALTLLKQVELVNDPRFNVAIIDNIFANPKTAKQTVMNILKFSDELTGSLATLKKIRLENDPEVIQCLVKYPQNASKIAKAFFMLSNMQIRIDNPTIKKNILDHSDNAIEVAKAIIQSGMSSRATVFSVGAVAPISERAAPAVSVSHNKITKI
ncbi:MAG: hypothetical protein ACYCQI_10450 [Gammaproteobacteria bacterium]